VLLWVFVGDDDVQFNNLINNNKTMTLIIEIEHTNVNFKIKY
jgi:hypothetical protein